VKQLVEVFTKRTELLPSDESVDQHTQRRAEEIAEVEKDKNGPAGLFKGTFPSRNAELYRDEVDGGVMRCRECGFEHEGGPECRNCGADIDEDDYAFSDLDEDVEFDGLDALSLDMDDEIDLDLVEHGLYGSNHPYAGWRHPDPLHNIDLRDDVDDDSDSENSENAGSLEDFVEEDEDDEPARGPGRSNARSNQSAPIQISDDESDEGGEISSRIPRNRGRTFRPSISSSPSVASNTDDAADVSDTNSEADRLRRSGWSPLDQGPDSDAEEQFQFRSGYEYTEDDQNSEDNSDTETIGGNGPSDDETDPSRDSMSPTPTYGGRDGYPPYIPHEHIPTTNGYSSASEPSEADDESESGYMYDRDGDTEMSLSPRLNRNRSETPGDEEHLSVNDYPSSRSTRSMSRSAYENAPETNDHTTEDLGVANEVLDLDDDSDTPRRPVRRRRAMNRQQSPNERARQYDPRISMIFAEHQQSLRSDPEQTDLDELDNEIRRIEPGPRNRRMTAYRHLPPRRNDPLRVTRSPSATRIIASSSRISRPPRNYSFNRGQAS
jgi:hypothetical protein